MTDIAHRPAEEKSFDLRAAIDILKQYEGEYIETSEPVDSAAELSGVYRYIGAGGTVMRPTRTGPAMVFNKVKGYEDFRVLIGLLASRACWGCRRRIWLTCCANRCIAPSRRW